MDIAKAKAMIASQRWHWQRSIFPNLRTLTSDDAIASKAERVYLVLAMMWFGMAALLSALHPGSSWGFLPSLVFLIGAFVFVWRSRRLAQARRLLESPGAGANLHP